MQPHILRHFKQLKATFLLYFKMFKVSFNGIMLNINWILNVRTHLTFVKLEISYFNLNDFRIMDLLKITAQA